MYNSFTPAVLRTSNAYGWTGTRYNLLDIPGYVRAGRNRSDWLQENFSYEWFDFSNPLNRRSNPPFLSGAAGELLPSTHPIPGRSGRILRGFIRRAQFEVNNGPSYCRLYFMYNPEVIVRDYVSYLDQGALDPFNTVFESKNLVAPPSFLDFSFQLFFDRQTEAQGVDNPGVFVDLEYFDLVVRNVIPRGTPTANTLPDSGVMMVNPRDITVVFSPQITIQGRPLNARIAFEKFTHRMVPTRMRIDLTVRVIYIGPMQDMVEYKAEEFTYSNTVPWGEIKNEHYEFRYNELVVELPKDAQDDQDQEREDVDAANKKARNDALDYAQDHSKDTKYNSVKPDEVWKYANSPSMVWAAYNGIEMGSGIGFTADKSPTVAEMVQLWKGANNRRALLTVLPKGDDRKALRWQLIDNLGRGDLLLRDTGSPTIAWITNNDINYKGDAVSGKLQIFKMWADGAHNETYSMEDEDDRKVLAEYTHYAIPTPIAQTVSGPGPTPPSELKDKLERIKAGDEAPYLVWINGTNGSEYDLLNPGYYTSGEQAGDGQVPGVVDAFAVGEAGDTHYAERGQLQSDVAAALQKIVDTVGHKVTAWGCRRTYYLQTHSSHLAGHPSHSLHVVGLAIDVDTSQTDVHTAMDEQGWDDGSDWGERHHRTYLVRG